MAQHGAQLSGDGKAQRGSGIAPSRTVSRGEAGWSEAPRPNAGAMRRVGNAPNGRSAGHWQSTAWQSVEKRWLSDATKRMVQAERDSATAPRRGERLRTAGYGSAVQRGALAKSSGTRLRLSKVRHWQRPESQAECSTGDVQRRTEWPSGASWGAEPTTLYERMDWMCGTNHRLRPGLRRAGLGVDGPDLGLVNPARERHARAPRPDHRLCDCP